MIALLLSSRGAIAENPPARTAQEKIDAICARQPLSSSAVSVFAMRMDGDTIAVKDRKLKLVPASNMKLITTGVALTELGEDFRFETRLAYSGSIVDGTLKGDLYIIGGGDPTTGARVTCADPVDVLFSRWARILRDKGIQRIDGRVVADPRYFDCVTPENTGWTYDDLGTNYGAGATGLNFFENAQNFLITPGASEGSRPNIEARYPLTPWILQKNTAVTGPARSRNTVYLINTELGPYIRFCGSFPIDRKGYTYEGANRFGAYTCASYFCNYLETNGIKVSGGPADIDLEGYVRSLPGFGNDGDRAKAQAELSVIGRSFSAKLPDIMRETNYESDNFFAETLFKTVSKHSGRSSEYDACAEAEKAALTKMGLNPNGTVQIFDGSGLSRKNYVSTEFFVNFLMKMYSGPQADIYLSTIPQPGQRGTLEYKFSDKSQDFRSRIYMKSGSMNGVYCYSGYILAPDGDPSRTVVFSILTNNVTASTWMTMPSIDSIIEALASEY